MGPILHSGCRRPQASYGRRGYSPLVRESANRQRFRPLGAAPLGLLALALLVSFSVPVSCLHGAISSWLSPLHYSEIHNKLSAQYTADLSELAWNGSKAPESAGHHTHNPGEDIQAPLSQAIPDHLRMVLVPAPSVRWVVDESRLGPVVQPLPLEPPPRQVTPS